MRNKKRQKKGLGLLRGRVAAIVRVKPQLSHAKGPITRVRFFSLDSDGVQSDGDLFLQDGRLVADPPDSQALQNVLKDPVYWYDVNTNDEVTILTSTAHSEEFLAAPEMKYMSPETRKNWGTAKTNYLSNPNFTKEHAEKLIQL